MTWLACGAEGLACGAEGLACGAEGLACGAEDLRERCGRDGSFSLWSAAFGEGFHSGRGALREARETFLAPSQPERFGTAGRPLRLVEVCVGTGSNLAVLLEACAAQGVSLEWRGLEADRRPLELALASPGFRQPWRGDTLTRLEHLLRHDHWQSDDPCPSQGRILWGDARRSLEDVLGEWRGQVDLIWHDAFSPQRCPQLWSQDWLALLCGLLRPEGRWLSYCSAAAVRETLRGQGMELAALVSPGDSPTAEAGWSGGTVASWQPLPTSPHWRALMAMEWEHLASSAGMPYRDPDANGDAAAILEQRRQAQAAAVASGEREASGSWRARWGLTRTLRTPHLRGLLLVPLATAVLGLPLPPGWPAATSLQPVSAQESPRLGAPEPRRRVPEAPLSAAEARTAAERWLLGLGARGLVLRHSLSGTDGTPAGGFESRRIRSSHWQGEHTTLLLTAPDWQLQLGFRGPVSPRSDRASVRRLFDFLTLDRLPTPGLNLPGWEVRPLTPSSHVVEGVEILRWGEGRIRLRVRTRFFALQGHNPQAISRLPADAPAPAASHFQIRRSFPLDLLLDLPVREAICSGGAGCT